MKEGHENIEALKKEHKPEIEKVNQLIDDTESRLAETEGLAQNDANLEIGVTKPHSFRRIPGRVPLDF